MSHKKFHHPNCLNCHYPLAEFDKFCPNCGQKPISPKSSMHDLLHEFFHTFWHLDGKFFMTLHHLLIPGKLTIEFFKGHLKRYAHPIQLFLVLGAFAFGTLASKARIAEESAQSSVEKRRDEYKRKAFLNELDSVRKTLVPPQYASAQKQLLSDSLMFKMMYPEGIAVDREKIEKEVNDAIDKEFNKHYDKKENRISVGLGSKDSKITYSVTSEEDSVHEAREDFKDSIIDALVEIDKKKEKSAAFKIYDSKTEQTEEQNSQSPLKQAAEGFKAGWNDQPNEKLIEKLRPKIDFIKQKRDLKEAVRMYEDTNNISVMGQALRIPSREMYELTPDEIIEKYKIEGFWTKTFTKQALKATQGAGDLIHFYMSKLFWATVMLIPALALFFSLMYWRKKHFYVEHIVFLLNFNTAAFLVLIPTLWLMNYNKYNKYVLPIYFVWFAVHFIASLKAYYQQSWRKTLLKSTIIALAYFFIATVFITLGAIIGLIFF